jgi:hypothetical protein
MSDDLTEKADALISQLKASGEIERFAKGGKQCQKQPLSSYSTNGF